MAKRGRKPFYLMDQRIAKLLGALALGTSVKAACQLSGIAQGTYYRYLQVAKHPTDSTPETCEFSERVERALGAAEASYVKTIHYATYNSWQAAAWILERRWPDLWARQERSEAMLKKSVAQLAAELGISEEEVIKEAEDFLSGGR